jgi:hypothetical protein
MIVGIVILFIAGIGATIGAYFLVRWQMWWLKNGKPIKATVIYRKVYYGSGDMGGSSQSGGYRVGVQYEIDGRTYKSEFDGKR